MSLITNPTKFLTVQCPKAKEERNKNLTVSPPSPIALQSTTDTSKQEAIKIFILLNNFSWRVKNIEIYYPLNVVMGKEARRGKVFPR